MSLSLSSRQFSRNSFALLALIGLAFTSSAMTASAQSLAQPSPRILAPVSELKLTKLPGNVPLRIRTATDLGPADASTQLTHMRLVLGRSAQQQADLTQYLADLQSKSSPSYHKWLTPEQFGKLYGPADSDLAAIVAWLQSHGFQLEKVSTGHTDIAFSGTVGQVQEAFHTNVHSFQAKAAGKVGESTQFYSNVADPSIPSALASVVKGVAHLDTIRPVAHNIPGRSGTFNPQTKRLEPTSGFDRAKFGPQYTSGSGTSADPYNMYLVPGDAATIYNTPTNFNANFGSSSTVYNGTGITIGVGGDAAILPTVVASYRTRFMNNSTQPTITNVDGVTSTSDAGEAYLDNELAGGIAPGASLHYYTSSDLTSAIEMMLSDNTVDIFSLSFGECEYYLDNASNTLLNGYWEQAATQGIAVVVSSGDNGSAGCDAVTDSNGNDYPTADFGLNVSGFASTPYNVAVGGTDLIGLKTAYLTYANTNATSTNLYRSALKYIPEAAWNDSSPTDTTIANNVPQDGVTVPMNIAGGSGGKSSCAVQNDSTSVCTKGYAKPSWQRGTGVPNDGVRDIPDVSLMSGDRVDFGAWLVCTDDMGTVSGVTVTADCSTQSDGNFYFFGYGGTSTAAPTFAGMLALVQQKQGDRLGQAAQGLYDLYNSSHATTVFHDTIVGNNSVPCDSGTPDCVSNSQNHFFESGYNTTTGYDLATGLGSVDATQLVNYWGSAIGVTAATVTVTPTATAITVSQSLNVAVAVTGASGTPSGTVTLSSGSYTSAASSLSANGATSFTIPAGTLSAGTDTLKVSYSGDAIYATATGTATVTVTAPAAPAVTLNPTSLTFTSTVGVAAASQSVTVTNSGNASLTISSVAITGAAASSYSETNTCTASIAANGTCLITVVFTPSTNGPLAAAITITDNASGSPQSVSLSGTGTAVVPTGSFTLSATSPTTTKGTAATSTVTAVSTGYAGTINLSCSITAMTGGNDAPTCSANTITLTSGATGTGTVTITSTAAAAKRGQLASNTSTVSAGRWLGIGGIVAAGLLFFGIPARRRAWKSLLSVFLLVSALGVLSGCGSSGHKDTGTTSGTYNVTVTGTDSTVSTITASTTFTVTIN